MAVDGQRQPRKGKQLDSPGERSYLTALFGGLYHNQSSSLGWLLIVVVFIVVVVLVVVVPLTVVALPGSANLTQFRYNISLHKFTANV